METIKIGDIFTYGDQCRGIVTELRRNEVILQMFGRISCLSISEKDISRWLRDKNHHIDNLVVLKQGERKWGVYQMNYGLRMAGQSERFYVGTFKNKGDAKKAYPEAKN